MAEYRLDPWVWWRFLDIFLIWLHGEESLREFFEFVNSYHKTIKYTWQWSKTEIPFLDVWVSLEKGEIDTDVFCKPTDTHQYLDSRSCHQKYVKRSIPYGQALRY